MPPPPPPAAAAAPPSTPGHGLSASAPDSAQAGPQAPTPIGAGAESDAGVASACELEEATGVLRAALVTYALHCGAFASAFDLACDLGHSLRAGTDAASAPACRGGRSAEHSWARPIGECA
mmetsp:Transcript_10441/g.30943  ORF Transcript_10441/g.30943 Transcript_10441/m.30943 type:complete len:121 (-) Transcript_10441:118-480(-)